MSNTGRLFHSELEEAWDVIHELEDKLKFALFVIKAHAENSKAAMEPTSATQMAIKEIEQTLERLKP